MGHVKNGQNLQAIKKVGSQPTSRFILSKKFSLDKNHDGFSCGFIWPKLTR
jgi:hypothetical protein